MKIAYVSADQGVPVFGSKGCSVHVQEVLRSMLKAGHEVHLYAARTGRDVCISSTKLRLHSLPPLPQADTAARESAALALNDWLHDALAEESSVAAFDLIYERQSLWSCAALEFARERSMASVLEVNAPLIEEQARHRTLLNRETAEEIENRAFRAATVIAAVSSELAQWLQKRPNARGKVHVVPNAVNAGRFRDCAPTLKERDSFVVGFVGTLKAWHGLRTLIDGFALFAKECPHARLLLVGDGPEREPMEQHAASQNISGVVRFTGAVPPDAVPGFLASMDVAVAPYPPLTDFYFSPLKLYEYMAAGRATVASRIGQIEEVIEHGRTGLLVPAGDVPALASALRSLENDPAQRLRLGEAAAAAVCDKTWDNLLSRVLALAGVNPHAEVIRH
jgi:glycosyltransferase involved in cell wall biosynthesis